MICFETISIVYLDMNTLKGGEKKFMPAVLDIMGKLHHTN